jgi:hypothetical protein
MRLSFSHNGKPGSVDVTIAQPDDPTQHGQSADTRGFPTCTAVIEHPAKGYDALFGWVQLVHSPDNSVDGASFDMDPFILFKDAPSPYAFFGVKPVLFDAPARAERRPMAWLAHSFLAHTPLDLPERPVVPLLGFGWGFDITAGGEIAVREAHPLAEADWAAHIPYLAECHPGWTFPLSETAWLSGSA